MSVQLFPVAPNTFPPKPARIVLDEVTTESIALDKLEQRRAKHDAVLQERTSSAAVALLLAACPEDIPTVRLLLTMMHRYAMYRVVQDLERALSEQRGVSSILDPRR